MDEIIESALSRCPLESCSIDLVVMQKGKPGTMTTELALIAEKLVKKYYEKSTMKWDTKAKAKELSQPGMHHIIIRKSQSIICFASVLACKEPDLRRKLVPVFYIYELHVIPDYQGLGLGRWLLDALIMPLAKLEHFVGCQKLMLTCQTSNSRALDFYRKNGFSPDEICPSRCFGKTEATRIGYQILSRNI